METIMKSLEEWKSEPSSAPSSEQPTENNASLQSKNSTDPTVEQPKSTNSILPADAPFSFKGSWAWWYDDAPPKGISKTSYENIIKPILGSFNTIPTFLRFWAHLSDISILPHYSNLRLFREGTKPLWEDPENVNGGKWVIHVPYNHGASPRLSSTTAMSSIPPTMIPEVLQLWHKLVLMTITERLPYASDVCGIVARVRPEEVVLQVWTRTLEVGNEKSPEGGMKVALKKALELPPYLEVLLQEHQTSLDFTKNFVHIPKNKRRNSVASPPLSGVSSPLLGYSSPHVIPGRKQSSPLLELQPLDQLGPLDPRANGRGKFGAGNEIDLSKVKPPLQQQPQFHGQFGRKGSTPGLMSNNMFSTPPSYMNFASATPSAQMPPMSPSMGPSAAIFSSAPPPVLANPGSGALLATPPMHSSSPLLAHPLHSSANNTPNSFSPLIGADPRFMRRNSAAPSIMAFPPSSVAQYRPSSPYRPGTPGVISTTTPPPTPPVGTSALPVSPPPTTTSVGAVPGSPSLRHTGAPVPAAGAGALNRSRPPSTQPLRDHSSTTQLKVEELERRIASGPPASFNSWVNLPTTVTFINDLVKITSTSPSPVPVSPAIQAPLTSPMMRSSALRADSTPFVPTSSPLLPTPLLAPTSTALFSPALGAVFSSKLKVSGEAGSAFKATSPSMSSAAGSPVVPTFSLMDPTSPTMGAMSGAPGSLANLPSLNDAPASPPSPLTPAVSS